MESGDGKGHHDTPPVYWKLSIKTYFSFHPLLPSQPPISISSKGWCQSGPNVWSGEARDDWGWTLLHEVAHIGAAQHIIKVRLRRCF